MVIAILGVLATLSAAAMLRVIGAQHASSTRTLLARLQSQLDVEWAAVTRAAKDEPIPDAVRKHPDFQALAGTDLLATGRARVVYVKLKQRQAFPTSFDEALNPHPLPPLPAHATALRDLGITRSTPQTRPYESAVCLWLALDRSSREDQTPDNAQLALPGGKQAAYPIDGWRNPVAFCRWPTGSVELNPAGPAPGRNDPDDPEGLLDVPAWLGSPAAAKFRTLCHDLPPRAANAGPSSYTLAPLVASAGSDGKLDLDPRTFKSQGAGADDNLHGNHPR